MTRWNGYGALHDYAVDAKESHQLLGPELVSRWAAYFPPAPSESLFRWLASRDGQNKVLNIPISNVPGPREHGRVGGALVTEIYSVGPLTAGSGLNITVWSYVDQLNVSVLADGATVEDPHEVTDADHGRACRNPPCRRAFRKADGYRKRDGAGLNLIRRSGRRGVEAHVLPDFERFGIGLSLRGGQKECTRL